MIGAGDAMVGFIDIDAEVAGARYEPCERLTILAREG
jgi:hypothetical protein